MGAITFDQDFKHVLGPLVGIAIQCIFTAFVAGGARKKAFSEEFLRKNFGEQHKKATGEDFPKGGYPDNGTGLYASKLDYATWWKFNNRQRAHYNFLEQVASIAVMLIVGGLAYPCASAVLGWIYFVGRIIYTFGYVAKGPKGRVVGALILDVGLLGLLGVSVMSVVNLYRN